MSKTFTRLRGVATLPAEPSILPVDSYQIGRGWPEWLASHKLLVVGVIFLCAFAMRVYHLDAYGFAEDEANKLFAVRVYAQGDPTVNADHPMLMKLLCYGSIHAARWWNEAFGERLGMAMSDETALRLPNALFGALTVVPILLLGTALLGFRAGLIASLLWAFGLNAIWINRIGKEDTLLVFFMLTAFTLYHHAKRQPASDERRQVMWYALAGAAFGLMMASKYFPHFFGLCMLFYYLAGYDSRDNRPFTRRTLMSFYAAMIAAFAACNFAAFLPSTWRYLAQYVSADLITHHGYLFGDTLYKNLISQTPHGTPWYFYFLFLGVKLPIPVLLAFLVGLIEIFRHRGDREVARGYLFLRVMLVFWLFPMAVIGSKFLRYTLSLMPLIYMTAAVGVLTMWRLAAQGLKKLAMADARARWAAGAAAAAIFIIMPAVTAVRSMPYPSLYMNAFGSGRAGYFFPHDEFYDLGARESIRYVAENAPAGASLASEIPGVVQYYLERYKRQDIRSLIISHPRFDLWSDRPDYVLVQRGRMYFENRDDLLLLQRRHTPVQASRFREAEAALVYHPNGGADRASGPINPR